VHYLFVNFHTHLPGDVELFDASTHAWHGLH